MRLFLAIHLTEEVRQQVAAVQDRLKTTGADVKWVETANFHLTVKFIGEFSEALLPNIEAVCAEIALSTSPFRFRVFGGSSFPKRSPQIKTLLMGIAEGAEEWRQLAVNAETSLAPFGVAREGGLAPHITLGRVKGDKGPEPLRNALSQEAQTDCGVQVAEEMALIQTFLDPSGATYKDIRRWKLGV